MKVPYPCWVFRTRYGGTYENGEWAAIDCPPELLPADAEGCDPDCLAWWSEVRANEGRFGRYAHLIAVGATPSDAVEALVNLGAETM